MKKAIGLVLLMLLFGCGPLLSELIKKPALFESYEVDRSVSDVYRGINAKVLECESDFNFQRHGEYFPDTNDAEIRLLNIDGVSALMYVQITPVGEHKAKVVVYSAYSYSAWQARMDTIRLGAEGKAGCR